MFLVKNLTTRQQDTAGVHDMAGRCRDADRQSHISAIRQYLPQRVGPVLQACLRYEDAVELVENTKMKEKIRERMLYLLRKASDKDSLSAALDAMQEKFALPQHGLQSDRKGAVQNRAIQ